MDVKREKGGGGGILQGANQRERERARFNHPEHADNRNRSGKGAPAHHHSASADGPHVGEQNVGEEATRQLERLHVAGARIDVGTGKDGASAQAIGAGLSVPNLAGPASNYRCRLRNRLRLVHLRRVERCVRQPHAEAVGMVIVVWGEREESRGTGGFQNRAQQKSRFHL